MTTVVCPGSFDPPTRGHIDIVERTARLFDRVIVCVVHNPNKHGTFPAAQRVALLRDATAHLANVEVDSYTGLLVDYCHARGARSVIKGLRGATDYTYEEPMAHMNYDISAPERVDTLFIAGDPARSYVSSSLVREVATLGGAVDHLVPEPVAVALREKFPPRGAASPTAKPKQPQ